MLETINESLRALCEVSGTSGLENLAAEKAKEMLSIYMPCSIDNLGNVVGSIGEGVHILLDAHIDQIGLSVTGVDEDGFVKCARCGGPDARVLTAAQVTIHGEKDIKGIVVSVPPHLQKEKDDGKVPDFDNVLIDIGLSKEDADKVIFPGDRITFDGHYMELLGTRVSSPSIDDRSGVVAILRCLELLEGIDTGCKISVMFSAQEETGGSGAKVGAFTVQADEGFAVDVSFAKQPGVDEEKYAELGKGTMIGFSPVLDHEISKKLIDVATRNNIPYQCEVMGSRTGTNADDIQVAGKGIKSSVISIPLRNMHTAVEVCDLNDIENTARLLAEYIKERGAK